MCQKIVLVGNAYPNKDYSNFIDSHDIIIRFNHVNFLHTKKVGTRCDFLVIQNMDEDYRNGRGTYQDCNNIIFIAENVDKNFSHLIIESNKWHNKSFNIVYSDTLEIKEKLEGNNGSRGFIILNWLLKQSEKWDLPISLVCFTWQGWKGHAWDKEKNKCHNYEEKGLITIL